MFSFSSPSFHPSLPTLFDFLSLLTTCETYAMWLIWELPNLLYPLPHHCPHMFLYIYPYCPCVNNPAFAQFLTTTLQFCLISSASLHRPGRSHFTCGSSSSLPSSPPPSLNPVELVFPPSLPSVFCRAPVTPSGVTRTVSDSRRTCYLVTRL